MMLACDAARTVLDCLDTSGTVRTKDGGCDDSVSEGLATDWLATIPLGSVLIIVAVIVFVVG